jgi:starch phosphorylase
LTIGFARRFTGYKRPLLMIQDVHWLMRLLVSKDRPVQFVFAGKAHPNDWQGRDAVKEIVSFCRRPEVRHQAIFLEDYDMAVAQMMVGGVDVWLNTPTRPYEACGTSGMKTLVNGGLHFSTLDGWWDEAYSPEVGWSIGGRGWAGRNMDESDAYDLRRALESEIIPMFYRRDSEGLPREWLKKVRASMVNLTPLFSSDRMVKDYVEQAYTRASHAYDVRNSDSGKIAHQLADWQRKVDTEWAHLQFEDLHVTRDNSDLHFSVAVNIAGLEPDQVRVELCAYDHENQRNLVVPMHHEPLSATVIECKAQVTTQRPSEHFTPRVRPYHPARLATELPLVKWQK